MGIEGERGGWGEDISQRERMGIVGCEDLIDMTNQSV